MPGACGRQGTGSKGLRGGPPGSWQAALRSTTCSARPYVRSAGTRRSVATCDVTEMHMVTSLKSSGTCNNSRLFSTFNTFL